MKIKDLAPTPIWKNFIALNKIPRPSKKEEKVIAFIQSLGEALGLPTMTDQTGNVLIRKPATPGMENRKTITLQSHLDMVCQKREGVHFDFDTEGIRMKTDGEWVMAEGTTLGADNGIGVATILSILESRDIPHPPLEALFTVDEETGMTGAFGLKPGFLKGDILLNLDTEEDDEIDIGCAGGIDVTAEGTFKSEAIKGNSFSLTIEGLQGGHSGIDIHKERGNANVLLRRLLFAGLPLRIQLISIHSGGVRNAIPREAKAVIYVEDKQAYLQEVNQLIQSMKAELGATEPALEIRIDQKSFEGRGLSVEDSKKIIQALTAAHNGVYKRNSEILSVVESSNNIAQILLEEAQLKIFCLARSFSESTKQEVAYQLQSSFEPAGLQVTFSGSYPGWQPDPQSEILKIMKELYLKKFKEDPRVIACHAGLECGIIGAHYPNMEMISFGPAILGAHTPDEKVKVKSVQKFWAFLKDILKNIPEK